MGELGLVSVEWSVIATACFLLSFLIAWQAVIANKPVSAKSQSTTVSGRLRGLHAAPGRVQRFATHDWL